MGEHRHRSQTKLFVEYTVIKRSVGTQTMGQKIEHGTEHRHRSQTKLFVEYTVIKRSVGTQTMGQTVFRYRKNQWNHYVTTTSDNNYDMGSLYVQSDKVLRIVGPSIDGPQAYNPDGEVAMWESIDGAKPGKTRGK